MGVLVPPKPEEPDNCCMSGCVNCVWDTYREEMELWADANREVEKRRLLAASRDGTQEEGPQMQKGVVDNKEEARDEGVVGLRRRGIGQLQKQTSAASSLRMDSHGGGSESSCDELGNPMSKNLWDDELYKNVPVGIREFMKLEKKLKGVERQEKSVGSRPP